MLPNQLTTPEIIHNSIDEKKLSVVRRYAPEILLILSVFLSSFFIMKYLGQIDQTREYFILHSVKTDDNTKELITVIKNNTDVIEKSNNLRADMLEIINEIKQSIKEIKHDR